MAPAGELAEVMQINRHGRRRFIRATGMLVASMFAGAASREAAIAGEIHWNNMGQVCGYAVSVVPIKKVIRRSGGISETVLYRNPLKGATVAIFRADNERTTCCQENTKVGEVVTNRDGRFQFGAYVAGYYWLVIHSQASEIKVPIRVDEYNQRACEDHNVVRIIFADAQPEPRVEVHII